MTPAQINRAVAEACGYVVKPYGDCSSELWLFDDCDRPVMPLSSFVPTSSANQAIEALDRVFPRGFVIDCGSIEKRWEVFAELAGLDDVSGESNDPDPVKAFCEAACNAILAAKGKK